ncbi:MAG: MBL fold metallo-hydrolase [bacterium]
MAIPVSWNATGSLVCFVGRRHPKSRFLGGFFAFPGGVIEPADGDPDSADEQEVLARTASRELAEETGLVIAPEALLPAGWRETPPFGPRRFDTKMFLAPFERPVEPGPVESSELIDLAWAEPGALFERWRRLEIRVAPPLVPMLRCLAEDSSGDAASIAARLRDVNVERPEQGPRIEFVPDIHMVLLRTATLPPATHTNCYLAGAREFVVIDPGASDPLELARLERQIEARRAEGGVPHAVLVTHHHSDHTGGVSFVAERWQLPVWAHAETFARGAGAARGRVLVDGERIDLSGGERLRILHTPGHAAGHVAVLEETRGSLFAGDLVSGVSTILVDTASGSLDLYLDSLRRLADCSARTLFPGHGPPLLDPPRAIAKLLEHRAAREAAILAAVEAGEESLPAITRRAYADTPGADPGLARRQAEAHLDRLERLGRVLRTTRGWRAAGA